MGLFTLFASLVSTINDTIKESNKKSDNMVAKSINTSNSVRNVNPIKIVFQMLITQIVFIMTI